MTSRDAEDGRAIHGGTLLAAMTGVGVVALVVTALVAPPGAAAADDDWRDVLRRAGEATVATHYEGEVLWVSEVDGVHHLQRIPVRNGASGLTAGTAGQITLRMGEGGDLVDGDGNIVTLPAVDADADDHLDLLLGKYDVSLGTPIDFLDRPCTTLEVRLRDGGELRERLWIDDGSGLVLRRETFESHAAEPVRFATYLSLDLRGERPGHRVSRGQAAVSGSERPHAVEVVDAAGVHALREAGWLVPEELPGGYDMLASYAVAATESQPLQSVYSDGLYVVSVFQQPGRPDWDALPDGLERVPELDWPAFEWPGATPRRILWEAQGRTWTLVGDAPPTEMMAIAGTLPQPEEPGVWRRLRRGWSRMWRAMSG